MLTYYMNIMDNNLAPQPNEQYRNDMQAFINEQWDNTTAMYTIKEQSIIGSDVYNNIEVWINKVVAQGSSMYKNGDDFRQLVFQSIDHPCVRGRYYIFDSNIWIAYYTDELASVVKDLAVRRCNNYLRWVDPGTGAIQKVPCVIDYEIGSARPKQDKDIIVPDNSMVIMVQGNDLTKKLKQNQRFIFNGRPFKLGGFNNTMMDDMTDDNASLYYYDLYLDVIQPTDDLQNSIANRYEYNYSINIIQDVTEQVKGFVGELNADVTFNGAVVDRPIKWVGNEFVTVDNGKYTLTGNVGDVATIRAYIDGNNMLYDEVKINIVGTVTTVYDIVVSPLYEEVKQNQTVTFKADLYKNSVIQADSVNAVTSGTDSGSYTFAINNNVCTLTCLKYSPIPLQIVFTSGAQTKTISIKLKPVF